MRTLGILACAVALCLFGTPAASEESPAATGIADYFARRDAAAIAALEAARTTASFPATLALADLYFMNGRLPRARRLLLQTLAEHPLDDIAIWLAWIELAAHHARDADRILEDVVATSDAATGARATLSLGWQRWLAGDLRGAAMAFGRLEDDATIPELAQHARLLRGDVLMLAHDHAAAEDALRRVTARPLVADAARDLAWIRHRRGDSAAARSDLEALARREDDGGPGVVPWPRVLRQGAGAVGRGWQRAYRDRPRGQDPTTFLLAVGDRNASADARAMLRAFFATTVPGGTRGTRERVAAADGGAPADLRAAPAASDRRPRARLRPTAGAPAWWTVVLLLVSLVAAAAVRRRRRVGVRG